MAGRGFVPRSDIVSVVHDFCEFDEASLKRAKTSNADLRKCQRGWVREWLLSLSAVSHPERDMEHMGAEMHTTLPPPGQSTEPPGARRPAHVTSAESRAARLGPTPTRTLLIDNYDSYTYNLYQLLAEINGAPPVVVRNDEYRDWAALRQGLAGKGIRTWDNIVLSPGPGRPQRKKDFGLCMDALRASCDEGIPLLGVCLGHQGLGYFYGCRVEPAPHVMHGRLSPVNITTSPENTPGVPLLRGMQDGFRVVRYHSLCVPESSITADQLLVLARAADDNVVMAMRHVSRPQYGVQFHPESVSTEHGLRLLENFRDITALWWRDAAENASAEHIPRSMDHRAWQRASGAPCARQLPHHPSQPPQKLAELPRWARLVPSSGCFRIRCCAMRKSLVGCRDTASIFRTCFRGQPMSWWLDSATRSGGRRSGAEGSLGKDHDDIQRLQTRFSFMGCGGGPWSKLVEFFLESASCEAEGVKLSRQRIDITRLTSQGGDLEEKSERAKCLWGKSIFDYAEEALGAAVPGGLENIVWCDPDGSTCPLPVECKLPFDFRGGLVGYLGYECKENCPPCSYVEPFAPHSVGRRVPGPMPTPDASFVFADRFVAIDHDEGDIFVVELGDAEAKDVGIQHEVDAKVKAMGIGRRRTPEETDAVRCAWMRETCEKIASISPAVGRGDAKQRKSSATDTRDPLAAMTPNRDRATYMSDVAQCLTAIRQGETYEVCLTNQLLVPRSEMGLGNDETIDVEHLYQTLRTVNPAPFAALYNVTSQIWGTEAHVKTDRRYAICCSSPERFLQITSEGLVESKPIKGTKKRSNDATKDAAIAASLKNSEKDRAENLMIVDLVRNDLGQACALGSIAVPKLMSIESFATVHQMVSTVQGRVLAAHHPVSSSIRVVRAAFPGGSMTGAPKLRTMRIIHELERARRGVYAGSLGYISMNGAVNFNIVIRTAVITKQGISVGTGGAIVALSDPADEYDEMLLKAQALARALAAAGIGKT